MTKSVACAIAALLISACGKNSGSPDAAGGDDANVAPDAGTDAFVPFFGYIYAHSYTDLYRVDPRTLAVVHVAPFVWPTDPTNEMMTDLAVDKDNHLTGISFGSVYSIDPDTAQTTYLAPLSGGFNGLTYVPATELGETGDDVLVGAALDGTVWRIDPSTGASTQIGAFGGGWVPSGDIVSVKGFGTVVTVNLNDPDAIDYLARIDFTNNAKATPIGSTGMYDIWGLGYWNGTIYGFVATNQIVSLDPIDGHATTLVDKGPMNWCGAGVTTLAPIP